MKFFKRDMLKKKTIFDRFLGSLTKKGLKSKAQRILIQSLILCSKFKSVSPSYLLNLIFKRLNTNVEIRSIKVRRREHCVPFSVYYNRRVYLVIKWILKAVIVNKRREPFSKKLSSEFLQTLVFKSHSLKYKFSNITQALKNRSNFHFRW
jgi:small subunit ribosomal protein S7